MWSNENPRTLLVGMSSDVATLEDSLTAPQKTKLRDEPHEPI